MIGNSYYFATGPPSNNGDSDCEEITIGCDDDDIKVSDVACDNETVANQDASSQIVDDLRTDTMDQDNFMQNYSSTMYYNLDNESTVAYQVINDGNQQFSLLDVVDGGDENVIDADSEGVTEGDVEIAGESEGSRSPMYYINVNGELYETTAPLQDNIQELDNNELFVTNSEIVEQTPHLIDWTDLDDESEIDFDLSDLSDTDSDASNSSEHNAAIIERILEQEDERLKSLRLQENMGEIEVIPPVKKKRISPAIILRKRKKLYLSQKEAMSGYDMSRLKFLNRIANRMNLGHVKQRRKQKHVQLNRSGAEITVQLIKLVKTFERKRKEISAIESSRKLSEVVIDEKNVVIPTNVTKSIDLNMIVDDSDDGTFLENYIRINNINFDKNSRRKMKKPPLPKKAKVENGPLLNSQELEEMRMRRVDFIMGDGNEDNDDDDDDDDGNNSDGHYKVFLKRNNQPKFESFVNKRRRRTTKPSHTVD